jgi:molybdopterin/thiamine biosynthesis adenylyltransferase
MFTEEQMQRYSRHIILQDVGGKGQQKLLAGKVLIIGACVLGNKPYSHGGILRFDGQAITVRPKVSACYRCIFPAPPPKDAIPTCSQAGVIGVLPGVIGTIQATEAIKFLLGKGDLLTDRLLTYNALQFAVIKDLRAKGRSMLVIYPSHPDTPARMSAEDLRLALTPNVSYLIVSLAETRPVVKSFRVENGAAISEPITVID